MTTFNITALPVGAGQGAQPAEAAPPGLSIGEVQSFIRSVLLAQFFAANTAAFALLDGVESKAAALTDAGQTITIDGQVYTLVADPEA